MEAAIFPRMHVSLYVANLAATVNFYTAFFGKPATKIRRGYAKYVLNQPSLIISFVENPERVHSHFGHLGFQVETEQELHTRLLAARAAGLVQREEVGTNCCYAKQDKFWVSDPDGVEWEVYYFHEDAEFNDPRYEESDNASQCCLAATATAPTIALPELMTVSVAEAAAPACALGNGCC